MENTVGEANGTDSLPPSHTRNLEMLSPSKNDSNQSLENVLAVSCHDFRVNLLCASTFKDQK